MNMVYKNQSTKQGGATLVIALVILLVMTMLGVASMKTSTLQERMASNARQKMIAKAAAEAALKRAEEWLRENITDSADIADGFDNQGTYAFTYSSTVRPSKGRPVGFDHVANDITDSQTWTSLGLGKSLDDADTNSKFQDSLLARQPRYIIEYIGQDKRGTANKIVTSLDAEGQGDNEIEPYFFRVTAIGWGRDPNIYVVLESNYKTGYGDFTY